MKFHEHITAYLCMKNSVTLYCDCHYAILTEDVINDVMSYGSAIWCLNASSIFVSLLLGHVSGFGLGP